jgi:hypothetical protein
MHSAAIVTDFTNHWISVDADKACGLRHNIKIVFFLYLLPVLLPKTVHFQYLNTNPRREEREL